MSELVKLVGLLIDPQGTGQLQIVMMVRRRVVCVCLRVSVCLHLWDYRCSNPWLCCKPPCRSSDLGPASAPDQIGKMLLAQAKKNGLSDEEQAALKAGVEKAGRAAFRKGLGLTSAAAAKVRGGWAPQRQRQPRPPEVLGPGSSVPCLWPGSRSWL